MKRLKPLPFLDCRDGLSAWHDGREDVAFHSDAEGEWDDVEEE